MPLSSSRKSPTAAALDHFTEATQVERAAPDLAGVECSPAEVVGRRPSSYRRAACQVEVPLANCRDAAPAAARP